MTWTTPRTGWLPGDVLTAAEMEALSEDVAYLQGHTRFLQMSVNSYATQFTTTGGPAWFLSAGLTMMEANSRILVMAMFGTVGSTVANGANLFVQRSLNGGAMNNLIYDLSDSLSLEASGAGWAPQNFTGTHSLIWLDGPGLAVGGTWLGQMGIQALGGDTAYVNYGNSSSIFIVAEVAG